MKIICRKFKFSKKKEKGLFHVNIWVHIECWRGEAETIVKGKQVGKERPNVSS